MRRKPCTKGNIATLGATISAASEGPTVVPLELQWHALLRDERDKREAARVLSSKPPAREFSKAVRNLWGAYEAALDMYIRALAGGCALDPPPLEILTALKIIVSYLAVGKMPGLVTDAISEGRRGAESRERRDIGFAVAYMMAASTTGFEHAGEQIIIADESPVKTVCEAFGVSRTTAQGWRKKIEPAFLGLNRMDGDILGSLMRDAAVQGGWPVGVCNRQKGHVQLSIVRRAVTGALLRVSFEGWLFLEGEPND